LKKPISSTGIRDYGVPGHRVEVIQGTEFTFLKKPSYLPAILAIAAFLLLLAMALGAYIDRNRTPKEPRMELHSPLVTLPQDQEKVWVQYFWGETHARYFKGKSGAPDVWMEVNDLAPEETARYYLSDLWGLPFRWASIPEVPTGIKQQLITDQLRRNGRIGL
jgi:hypothetical protein